MYNGIGLLTARGSGTSGYVQTNRFKLHRCATPYYFIPKSLQASSVCKQLKKIDPKILFHKKRRKIEDTLAKFGENLANQGYGPKYIDTMIKLERQQLLKYEESKLIRFGTYIPKNMFPMTNVFDALKTRKALCTKIREQKKNSYEPIKNSEDRNINRYKTLKKELMIKIKLERKLWRQISLKHYNKEIYIS